MNGQLNEWVVLSGEAPALSEQCEGPAKSLHSSVSESPESSQLPEAISGTPQFLWLAGLPVLSFISYGSLEISHGA